MAPWDHTDSIEPRGLQTEKIMPQTSVAEETPHALLGMSTIGTSTGTYMTNPEMMIAAIEAHCRALSCHDKEGWLALWAEDAVLEDPVGVDTYRGLETLRSTFWELIDALTPMKLWLERDVIVCGSEAIGILHGVVSREGVLRKVGPIVDHFTFDESGKIKMMRAFWKYA